MIYIIFDFETKLLNINEVSNTNMRYILGVDIGGTNIKSGLVHNNKVIKRIIVKTQAKKGKSIVIKNIISSIEKLMDKNVDIICLGCPGPLDYKTGMIVKTPNLPLQRINLKKIIENRFKKKVYIDNDANCFTLAEAVLGAGKRYENVVGLTLGTGLGSGLVIDKKIYHGKCFATEIGHATINFNGPKSKCGNNGCLESYVSIRGILSRAKGLNIKNVKELSNLASLGNKKALSTWQETGFYLGIGIVNIINILNPDIIVIGGQIANAWPFFSKKMEEIVKNRALFSCKIVKSKLRDAGILGAALLNIHHQYSSV